MINKQIGAHIHTSLSNIYCHLAAFLNPKQNKKCPNVAIAIYVYHTQVSHLFIILNRNHYTNEGTSLKEQSHYHEPR